MTILQVSTMNRGGGAASVPYDLFESYRERGHRSMLAVGYLRGNGSDPDVVEIPNAECAGAWARSVYSLPRYLQRKGLRGESFLRSLFQPLAEPRKTGNRRAGVEEFDYPGTRQLLNTIAADADIVHRHNLHGGYFDLRLLPSLACRVPIVMTMHDMWLLTGHCAYPIDCERWKNGCGNCPDLDLYPAVERDATRANWQRKHDILGRARPHIVAPCNWIIRNAEQVLGNRASYHVIPYGINLNHFRPGDKQSARSSLRLPSDGKIVLFVGSHAKRNRYKDYTAIEQAFCEIAARVTGRVTFVTVGDRPERDRLLGNCTLKSYPFVSTSQDLARFYQAADVFVHAANADTFPNVILEALACGLPGVATAVGGIPEQVDHGNTGFLTRRGDATEMAARVLQILEDDALARAFSDASVKRAREHFALPASVTAHLSLFEEILTGRHAAI